MEPIARKTYYSISEASALTGVKPHVLRYWESQFNVLSPTKNTGGNRVYRAHEIETILLVKRLLYEKRFTIAGARNELEKMRSGGDIADRRMVNVTPALLASIREELLALRRDLARSSPAAATDPDAFAAPSAGRSATEESPPEQSS